MPPPLLAVAHGSSVPAARATVLRLLDRVRTLLPEVEVHAAFLDHDGPRLAELPDGIVVPLLLSRGTHISRDLAAVAPPLGPDPLLTTALLQRIDDSHIARGIPLLLCALGTLSPEGQADVHTQAGLLCAAWGSEVTVGFLTAARPRMGEARATAGPDAAVVGYFLAEGRLPAASGSRTAPIGDTAPVAELVAARYLALRGRAGPG